MNEHVPRHKFHIRPAVTGDVSEFWRSAAKTITAPAPRSAAVESGRGRLAILSALFIVAFGAVCWQLVHLCVFPPKPDERMTGIAQGSYARADIVDRHGVLLARDLSYFDISIDPRRLTYPEDTAVALAHAVPRIDAGVLTKRFKNGSSFAYILRRATPKEADAVHALGLPGAEFKRVPQRAYPQGSLFSHVLGYTNVDNLGLAGIEKSRDDLLRAEEGSGKAVELAVDTEVQFAVRDVLEQGIIDYGAQGAIGVVMDVNNGEMLSLVSLPDFDPRHPSKPSDDNMRNRATTSLFEMGSTFKTITFAIGFDVGTLDLNEKFDATHPIRIGGHAISDYHATNRWLTPAEIFIHSSNIGAAEIALEYGGVVQREYLDRFGLLDASPIELPEVTPPLVQKQWGAVETATIAYGYGLAVSPVQLATAISTIVNGGYSVTPTLLRRREGAPEGRQVISFATSEKVRQMLRINAVEGTGKQANVPGYDVGGKTGTANRQADGNYADHGRVSSFVAVFPMSAPRYLVLVMLDQPTAVPDHPGLVPTGGATAAPLSGLIIRRIAPIMGMPPQGQEANAQEVKPKKS